MTDKERLNAILQLRLFFSTEQELSHFIGYNLRSNHFYRFKEFQADAYFSKFARLCRDYTAGSMDLSATLEEYEATSRFYRRYVADTAHGKRPTFLPTLLERVFLGADGSQAAPKDALLCERYMAESGKGGRLNIGILLLLTHRLLPTFKNKTAQDVRDITGDCQRAYEILMEVAQARRSTAYTVYRELPCLKEVRRVIEEEREGEKYLNRLALIDITNMVLARIFALEEPVRQMEISNNLVTKDFTPARFWRAEGEADNVVWEFAELKAVGCFLCFRNEIDYQARRVRYTSYQLYFRDCGRADVCYTIIMRPPFAYNNLLRREQPDDAVSSDYTQFECDSDGRTPTRLTFTSDSPTGTAPLTLTPAAPPAARYYQQYIDHTGAGEGFTDLNECQQYAVRTEPVEVSVSKTAILFFFGDSVYRLDKYDADGNETIRGVHALTHNDNFVLSQLTDGDRVRHFLCLDSINQNLEIDDLLTQPYFRQVTTLPEIEV